jgi:hypothetical protein
MCSTVEETAAEAETDDDPYERLQPRAPVDDEPPEPNRCPREFMWHFARSQGG